MLIDNPMYRTPAEWGTLYMRGLEIVPDYAYTVHAEVEGQGVVASSAAGITYPYGDVDGNSVANFADIQSVVLGFQGEWAGSIGAVDLAPCVPNAVINFEDVQQAVFAFQSQAFDQFCSIPCAGGVATASTEPASPVTLLMSADTERADSGELLQVSVWATAGTDLHAYQLALEVTDEYGFEVSPAAVEIDEARVDFVFKNAEVVAAANLTEGLVGASSLGNGVNIEGAMRRYLATFTFEIPADATGKWQFGISEGNAALALDSSGRSMPILATDLLLRVRGSNPKSRTQRGGRTMQRTR